MFVPPVDRGKGAPREMQDWTNTLTLFDAGGASLDMHRHEHLPGVDKIHALGRTVSQRQRCPLPVVPLPKFPASDSIVLYT